MVPYLNQKGTDTEGLSLILHLCMLCFASSILLLMVLIFMEDWREREREAYLSEKSMPVFLYNKLLLRNATKYVLLLPPEVESLKKRTFLHLILYFNGLTYRKKHT